MSFFQTTSGRPLGEGTITGLGALTDAELADKVNGYKRTVASRYRSLRPDELHKGLPSGALHVSPKIDGQFWCLIVDGDQVFFANPRGRVVTGSLPVLDELRATLVPRVSGRTVIAGELYALPTTKGERARCGDVAALLGGGAEGAVKRLGFQAFDLMQGGDATTAEPGFEYAGRFETLQRLLDGGKRGVAVKTEVVSSASEVADRYGAWVEGGRAEGLIARSDDGRVFKIKPVFTLDAAIIAFTESSRTAGEVGAMLLAVVRENGQFQHIGGCKARGTPEERKALFEQLTAMAVPSTYRHASSSGAMYRFIRPELVAEVRVTDLLSETSGGAPITRMVLEWQGEGWNAVRFMAGASVLHPVFERMRDDKAANAVDCRAAQVLERLVVDDLDSAAEAVNREPSTITRREVYTKASKGKTMVRKLLVFKTNKDGPDSDFPAWVVYLTDYSPVRKDPLKRTVRLAADEATATELAEALLKKNITRGWVAAP